MKLAVTLFVIALFYCGFEFAVAKEEPTMSDKIISAKINSYVDKPDLSKASPRQLERILAIDKKYQTKLWNAAGKYIIAQEYRIHFVDKQLGTKHGSHLGVKFGNDFDYETKLSKAVQDQNNDPKIKKAFASQVVEVKYAQMVLDPKIEELKKELDDLREKRMKEIKEAF